MKQYYIVKFKKEKAVYCIWYTSEEDGFVTKGSRMIYFKTLDDAKEYMLREKYTDASNTNEITECNLKKISVQIKNIENKIDCELVYDFWNITRDAMGSIGYQIADNNVGAKKIFDKLFWGLNLPSVTPEGKRFEPSWDSSEREKIKKLLEEGL